MKHLALVTSTAVLVVAQLAPPPPPGPPVPVFQPSPEVAPGRAARIEGIVQSTDGKPIGRATVRLQGTAVTDGVMTSFQQSATTAEDGTFVIAQIPPGRGYRLSAQRQGYANVAYGAGRATTVARPLTLARGQTLTDIVIEMPEQGVITGKVIDATGDPVPAAAVSLLRRGYDRGAPRLIATLTTNVNDIGEYRIAGLGAGTYYLRVSERKQPVNPTDRASAGGEANLTTFYPSAAEERRAIALTITPGAELRNITVQLLRGRTFGIAGRIVGPDGAPVAGMPLLALPEGARTEPEVILRSGIINSWLDGTFSISGLSPGGYTLMSLPNSGTQAVRMGVTIIDRDVTDLVVQAPAGITIAGSVTMEGGDLKPLLARAEGRPNFGLSIPDSPLAPRSGLLQDDGSFEVTNALPGRAVLNVTGLPNGVYVKSVRFGGEDVTPGDIEIAGGDAALEVVLSPSAATVMGAVPAMPGAPVSLWSAEPDSRLPNHGFAYAIPDQNGTFEFRGLPPGTYYLAAWEDADPGLLPKRDFLGKFTSAAMKIELAEGAQQAVEAPVISAEAYAAEEEKLP